MHIHFQQNWVCRSVKPCTQSSLHNIASCIDLQLPIVIWKKIIIFDMHHHKTYMYINFQQNRVKTRHDRAYKFIRKKIASCINLQLPIIIFKNRLFQTCIIVKRTCSSIFSKIGLVDQSKPCTQIYLQKIANCINLQLAIRISKNQAFRTCTTPLRTSRPILRSIGLLDIEIPRKEIISIDDRRTDRRRIRQLF